MYEWIKTAWQVPVDLWTRHQWLAIGGAVLVGAILARVIPAFLGRWSYEKLVTEKKSKDKERRKHAQIRGLLRESLAWNLVLLEKMEGQMTGREEGGRQAPTFNVDLAILESAAGLPLLETLDDTNTYSIVDRARYELTHVSRRINWLADMAMKRPGGLPEPSRQAIHASDRVFFELVHSTVALVHNCQGDCRNAIEALNRLDCSPDEATQVSVPRTPAVPEVALPPPPP